jgi:hypothetical protein
LYAVAVSSHERHRGLGLCGEARVSAVGARYSAPGMAGKTWTALRLMSGSLRLFGERRITNPHGRYFVVVAERTQGVRIQQQALTAARGNPIRRSTRTPARVRAQTARRRRGRARPSCPLAYQLGSGVRPRLPRLASAVGFGGAGRNNSPENAPAILPRGKARLVRVGKE